ncbi:MAG: hypothetical protein R8G66_17725 [Cytophagales bacterium]|nr:hypothetical protein [Cytophagales bacterium]
MAACSTNDQDLPVPRLITTVSEYSQLEVGNYWIYDWFEVQPDGSETPMELRDTLRIEADTLIEGRTMFVRAGTFMGQPRHEILYDSISHLLTYPERLPIFVFDSSQEFIRNFGPVDAPISIGTYRQKTAVETIEVPAGVFDCINFQGTIESLELDYPHGTRFNNNLYARDVGLVQLTTQFYSQPSDLEMRLVDFGRD